MGGNEELWQAVLSEIELQISKPNFVTWLKNSRLIEAQEGAALIALPNHFAKEWVEAKYNKLILGTIRNHDGSVRKIEYVVEGTLIKNNPKSRPVPEGDEKQLSFQEMRVDPLTNLNPRYTLNSFVVGSSNELAYSASTAVVNSVGVKYNPLFIYGGVGLGKTHLIQAIGNEIAGVYGGKVKVKYVTSEKFTNDVVWALRNNRAEDIKSAYRLVDVLIIDDIQFIGGKEKTEEEFFHTFNALHEQNKQIIISSDRPPQAIPTLEERLRSRFGGGIVVDISVPDYETRVAIIKTKLQERGAAIGDELIDVIAKRFQRNIREIEGILNKVIFYQLNYQKPLNLAGIEKIIDETIEHSKPNITPAQIIKAVALFFEISPTNLIGKGRSKEFIEPRQITIYLMREMLNMSYPYIASKIGNRDHTTAIYSYKKIADSVDKDPVLSNKLNMIKETVSKSV
ncbi:MAG: chromosomal replication initiator protein DnaA [Patescibacteria group bacterium]|nr:chromosomal replication initiator protein DnaA [Patescibacteria group bacterium]MCL5224120.1 chromosomal replication initiator protein DnaA [Patescibacteria group bacterium]